MKKSYFISKNEVYFQEFQISGMMMEPECMENMYHHHEFTQSHKIN